jgi:molybdenum cofactor guanylyltransferase
MVHGRVAPTEGPRHPRRPGGGARRGRVMGGTVAVVLAGGLARRMGGGDKPLRLLGGRPLLDHVLARIAPQVAAVALNANGDPRRFAAHGLPVVPDPLPGHPGPLAGIRAGLDWAAAARPEAVDVLSVPGDCPFLPSDLRARLEAMRRKARVPVACAASGGWRHPPVALWPVALREALREALLAGESKVARWAAHVGCAEAEWPAVPVDPFFNANTPEDLAQAERLIGRAGPVRTGDTRT